MIQEKFNPELYKDFLARKNNRPLFACMWEPMINPSREIVSRATTDKVLHAEDVQGKHILDIAHTVNKTLMELKGDLPIAMQASGGHQWLEAICGCSIMASDGQIWASHPEHNTLDDFLNAPLSTVWEEKLLQCHSEIIRFAQGRCFAAVPILHGPIDILSAFVGTENLAYAIYDEPDKLKQALKKAGDVFISIAKELTDALIPFMGGYCGRMYLYTERACATLQDDNSYMTSPAVFKEFLEPIERLIIETLPCTVYHMHNSSLHLGKIVAEYGMATIQMSVDPNGPPMDEQIAVYEDMKQETPLVLSCWNLDDMELFRQKLTPQGLALTFIPQPDGCQLNERGSFDDMPLWQEAYENWINLY
jgi:hypothetical protein